MSVKEQIEAEFNRARMERDQATENVIDILRQRVQKELEDDPERAEDDLWLRNVEAYAQKLRKAMLEFEALGDKAIAELAQARFEFGFIERFLPKPLDAAATEGLVRKLAAGAGINDPTRKDELMKLIEQIKIGNEVVVDDDLVRQAVDKLLAGN